MNTVVPAITAPGLILALLPAILVIGIMWHWRAGAGSAAYATARMLVQLFLIGYVLIAIFQSDNVAMILAVLAVMIAIASWIAIRTLAERDRRAYRDSLVAISLGCLPTLALVTQAVIDVVPWFSPRYIIPLAGMLFAGAMNTVSLAAERYEAETARRVATLDARRIALQTSMIPTVNSLFAVGLVTLPGMMTGQILSGVSPLVAAKYQIVVMAMLFGASGMAAAIYLTLRGNLDSSRSD